MKQMSRQDYRDSAGDYQADEQAVRRGSNCKYQADEEAGVVLLRWRLSVRGAGRCRAAQLSSIRQMSRQVSLGSADDYQADEQAGVGGLTGDYQADEQAGVARVSWRL